jgi:uncharacterized protein YhbP (UPF0306 family)
MNRTQEQLERIAALLGGETTLALATTGEDGQPSVAPLFYIADQELTIYWLSSAGSLHSRNLFRTPRAAATVYRRAESWKEICGVQMRGSVAAITDPERRSALLKMYCERFKLGAIFRVAIRRSTLYAFEPDFFRTIDNAKAFGSKFELTRGPDGWSAAKPGR